MIAIQEKTAEYAAPDQYDAGQRLHTPEQNISARRFGELDAIRGIAALIVVFHHWLITVANSDLHIRAGHFLNRLITEPRLWLEIPPFRLLFAGQASVGVFFVLSGFVLSLPILRGRQPSYRQYLIKRFFRIYVPFLIAILIATLLCLLTHPLQIPELQPWFNGSWNEPITPELVLSHLSMSGQSISLDNPMWSLIDEVRISLIFPVLAFLVVRWPVRVLATSSLVTGLIIVFRPAEAIAEFGLGAMRLLVSIEGTLANALYFVLGITIAANINSLTRFLGSYHPIARYSLWLIALVLLEAPPWTPLVNLLFIPPGAGLLISLSLTSTNAKSFLKKPFFYWLGRISYSLYLTHVIVLLSLVHLLFGKMPLLLILSLAFVLSLIVAELMCRLIELPAQRMGKRMARLNNK